MPASIGVNLRVTGHCSQGGRKYMEDFFSVAYQETEDEKDLEYAFVGIYDGHGGGEAATYAKEHLMESIVRQKCFWSDKDEDVLRAIKEGYIATHYAMWKEQANWPKTASGLPSTAGTTATIAFIRHAKIYIGHVGDSGVILGYQEPGEAQWRAKQLTNDHKPENAAEMFRIQQCGGKVVTKSGVPRVVWNRPRIGHKGPVRRSTPIDEIPFLAVARSLGDLWSYNSTCDQFVVSPDPDTCVIPIDTNTFRCLIFGTDGLWNMMSPDTAIRIVQNTERHNECIVFSPNVKQKIWINPSKSLVEHSLERWSTTRMRADNTTAVTLLLDPPGPPRAEVLQNQHNESMASNNFHSNSTERPENIANEMENRAYPTNGLAIVTRYPVDGYMIPDTDPLVHTVDNYDATSPVLQATPAFDSGKCDKTECQVPCSKSNVTTLDNTADNTPSSSELATKTSSTDIIDSHSSTSNSTPSNETAISSSSNVSIREEIESENIQINEVSSSSPEENPLEMKHDEENFIEQFKKRYQKLKLLKTKSNIIFSGRCTRSRDYHVDRRLRAVSSSSDSLSNKNSTLETRKRLRIYRKHHRKDEYTKGNRVTENQFININNKTTKLIPKSKFLLNERRTPRKRNVTPSTNSLQKLRSYHQNDKIETTVKEPPTKKIRQENSDCFIAVSRRTRSNTEANFNHDQENITTKSQQPLVPPIKEQRVQTRFRSLIRGSHSTEQISSCVSTRRNLRERNAIATNPVELLSKNAKHSNETIKTRMKGGTVVKQPVTTVIPTKSTVQTRNRMKRYK